MRYVKIMAGKSNCGSCLNFPITGLNLIHPVLCGLACLGVGGGGFFH